MRGKSHLRLAQYLVEHYLPDAPKSCQIAFRIGCIEPDRNPATYLKGSIRCEDTIIKTHAGSCVPFLPVWSGRKS